MNASPDPVRRPLRPRLSHRAVVDAGLRLVRDEGLAAVTMRRVADDLDVAAMSLYRHVEDRQALLVGMLDRVAAGIPHPPPQLTGRAELVAVFTAVHDALRRDPWVVELLVVDGLAGPSILPLIERTVAALRALGHPPLAARRVHDALVQYTYGAVLATRHDRPDSVARRVLHEGLRDPGDPAAPPRFPHLAALAEAVGGPRPAHDRDDYAFVLSAMLDALLPEGQ